MRFMSLQLDQPAVKLAAATGVMTLLGVFIYFGYSSAYQALAGSAKLPAREQYTELAFNNHLGLPHTATGKPQYIQFHIANHEGRLEDFPYIVKTTGPNSQSHQIDAGTVEIDDGATAIVNASYTLPIDSPLTEVTVYLPNQSQEIHFWVGETK
jgi:hypothetical protein